MRAFSLVPVLTILISGHLFAASGAIFFEEKVRPLLSAHCLQCHSEEKKIKGGLLLDRKAGWQKGGDSGPVIVPGHPEKSLLIAMVKHESGVEAMPPKSKLSDREIATLEEWIKMGAPDPRSQAIGEKVLSSGFDLEARKSWWSLQPVKSYDPPAVSDETWPRNDIDRFILAQLDQKKWKPAPAAERLSLFRRASITLTGLAPTAEELAEFEEDRSEDAYEKAIDRMLASPHFGEHWARQWMDLVRYGETKGFEMDFHMPAMHRYRDYLIRAFNADLPHDQFIREAFAGDQLEEPRFDPVTGHNESIIGPSFLTITDGQHGPPDIGGDEARVIDGSIKAIGSAFHGLTITCARCHDHKFDAITDEDYYSLYGIIRSSRLNYANVVTHPPKLITDLEKAHRTAIGDTLKSITPLPENLIATIREIISSPGTKAEVAKLRKLKGKPHSDRLNKFRAALSEAHGPLTSAWIFQVLFGKEAELAGLRHWIKSGNLPGPENHPASQSFTWHSDDMPAVDAPSFIIEGDRITSAVGSGHLAGHLSPRLDGALRSNEFTLDGKSVAIWVKGIGATISLRIRNYELVGTGPTTRVLRQRIEGHHWQRITFPTNLWKGETAYLEILQDGWARRFTSCREGDPNPNDRAYVAFTAKPPAWNSAWTGKADPAQAISDLFTSENKTPAQAEVLATLIRVGLLQTQKTPTLEKLIALRNTVPRPIYVRSLIDGHSYQQSVFIRGNHLKPSTKENPRHFLDGLGGEMISPHGSGRREWAEHLIAPENPLTARVRVNQLWARVFGRGIVSSVDDFGEMGTLPSHPELLDFLAKDFVKEGWSMKAMIRKIVLSQTFRMSSVPSETARQLDPENTLLQRMPVRRMEAESVRDHLLSVSGELKRNLHGPSVNAYVKDHPHSRAKPSDGPLDGQGRRSIYLAVRRNFLSSFLTAFDFPVLPEPVADRPVTTVPAQSLALLNHPLIHDQSKKWAQKILAQKSTPEERINHLHRQAFSRDATDEELKWAKAALDQLSKDQDELETWTALCHLMINRKEFLYVF
ncbi:MAG: PSD1 and planctomycete cytochrome C domain-containing protein [Akkermansiaceae bacterium]